MFFSSTYFLLFGSFLHGANHLSVTPIMWDPIRRKVQFDKSPFKLPKCYIYLLATFVHTIFIAFQTWRFDAAKMETQLTSNHLLILLTVHILIIILITPPILQPHVIIRDVNCMFKYLENHAANWMPLKLDAHTRKMFTYLHRCLSFFSVVGLIMTLLFGIHVLFYPSCPIYMTSVGMPLAYYYLPHWFSPLITLSVYPGAIIYSASMAAYACIMALNLQIVVTFILFVTPILCKDMRANLSKYRTFHKLRTLPSLLHEYRSFEVFHGIGMEFYGPLVLPFHATNWSVIVLGAYLVIKGNSNLITLIFMVPWVFATFIIWTLVLHFGGFYYKQGIKTVKSWNKLEWNKDERVYMKKIGKSCRPLRIGDQTHFKFTNVTVLLFITSVSRGIVRALLTLK